MHDPGFAADKLADLLHQASRAAGTIAPPLGLVPPDRDSAYDTQERLITLTGTPTAAWKVGTAPQPGEVLASPIPASCFHAGPASLPIAAFKPCGLELELAFRFGRDFEPGAAVHHEADVLAAIAEVAVAIEIVSSRYQGWPDVPDWLKVADLQNHGALIVGQPAPYSAAANFQTPALAFTLGGHSIAKSPPGNPAGDPRWLLTPFVNQTVARNLRITRNQWITTGSYSGIHFVMEPGLVAGIIEGLPTVSLALI